MPRYLNVSGRVLAQPNGEDWHPGTTQEWSADAVRHFLDYQQVAPVGQTPRAAPQDAQQAPADSAPDPKPKRARRAPSEPSSDAEEAT
ncbi:hypothetical protein [Deinococcus kurensis]|uniref:hypothetical protein n=1 Tax=Deinococcus kurensis TaxID=2662757 RepID=UPI0012D34F40|nr:hypothetical protein [Deinococcus kurensis]